MDTVRTSKRFTYNEGVINSSRRSTSSRRRSSSSSRRRRRRRRRRRSNTINQECQPVFPIMFVWRRPRLILKLL